MNLEDCSKRPELVSYSIINETNGTSFLKIYVRYMLKDLKKDLKTTRQVTKSQQCSITLGRIFILEVVRNKLDSLATTFF